MFHSIILTGALNLTHLQKYFPQGTFNNLTPNNPDFILIKPEPEKSIGIKEIRELKKKISRKPFRQKYKIVLIQQAGKLTTEAQNALLKTLEEPPNYTIIILSVSVADSLLPTIQSRCRIFHLPQEKTSLPENDCPQIQVFKKILASPKIGERLKLIQPYTKIDPKTKIKARQHALDFCQKSLLFLSLSNSSKPSHFLLLKSLQNSHNLLQKNINVKLVMENLVIYTLEVYS